MLLWPRRDQDVANCVRRQGGIQQDKEPTKKQAASAEVPEQALQIGVNQSSPEVTKEGPTTPEDNSGGRALQGEDSVDPREISSELLVQRGGRLPPQHAPPGKQLRRRPDQRYKVAVVVFATLLQFCRLPEQSAVDSVAEGEERDAEEL
ncbi:hypothetical protein NDU88_005899 [Pleurodeles waltl]|uniref:Uncharacterized protein n=1 Tax=Pleurodeles waltl TaxID=8319 RepID=A0AAV7L673_PLEWA|nr:hypothetical protein NDU88_005899 [Pleurodeles waltl]